jgi:hypothetical protein
MDAIERFDDLIALGQFGSATSIMTAKLPVHKSIAVSQSLDGNDDDTSERKNSIYS